MRRIAGRGNRPAPDLSPPALAALQAHSWPGNIWELENVLERLVISRPKTGAALDANAVTDALRAGEAGGGGIPAGDMQRLLNRPLRGAREAFEREYLMFHLSRFGGNVSRTAEAVGMDRAALHRKLRSLGIGVETVRDTIDAKAGNEQ